MYRFTPEFEVSGTRGNANEKIIIVNIRVKKTVTNSAQEVCIGNYLWAKSIASL